MEYTKQQIKNLQIFRLVVMNIIIFTIFHGRHYILICCVFNKEMCIVFITVSV